MSFGEILVKNKIISKNVLIESEQETIKTGANLDDALSKRGVSERDITEAKSEALGIPIKKVYSASNTPFEILKKVPEESVRYYKFVPVGFKDGVVEMGVVNPDDITTREALQFLSTKLNLPFKIFLISSSDFQKILKDYRGLGSEAVKILDELETVVTETKAGAKKEEIQSQAMITEEAPVTKMVGVILRHAIDGNASDIHIEPQENMLKVRFRVDGMLYTSLKLPSKVQESIVARIKILTNMKLDEKRKPQDGRFEMKIDDRHVDFRVSTFPTFFGEKVVIRILDATKGLKQLFDVGLIGKNLDLVKEALQKPYGLILLTGPTGSGKTTTLYAMLSMLDRERYNVVSLEDPIEYNLPGISQSQVRPEINYDFANGLRSILRQDPDMIMVGEIRDKETARLAIQAALTGHLVFSTLHTNNAIGVVPRLIDMGIDPFLISATLLLGIAQRLVRTLCPDSRKPLKVEGTVKETLDLELKDVNLKIKEKTKYPKEIYQALPSPRCPRGTRGRIGVFEVLKMSSELEKIILASPSEAAIGEEAVRQGMLTMRQDGVLKVLSGIIGLEELREVI